MVVIDKPTTQATQTIFHKKKTMARNTKIFSGGKMKIKYPLPLKNITIKLKRSGGLAAYHYELIIYGNGEAIYNGGDDIKEIVIRKGKISQSQIFTLFKRAMEIGFFEMKSGYYFEGYRLDKKGMIQCYNGIVYDFPIYDVEIKIGNKKKYVTDWGGAPERFKKFANMIDRLYKPEKWITLKNITYSKL